MIMMMMVMYGDMNLRPGTSARAMLNDEDVVNDAVDVVVVVDLVVPMMSLIPIASNSNTTLARLLLWISGTVTPSKASYCSFV